MSRIIHQDYAVVNGRGVIVHTFGDAKSAKDWAKDNAHKHVGLYVEEVTLTGRTIYKPRQAPVFDFSIPSIGVRA